jgi:hypothetical protein
LTSMVVALALFCVFLFLPAILLVIKDNAPQPA